MVDMEPALRSIIISVVCTTVIDMISNRLSRSNSDDCMLSEYSEFHVNLDTDILHSNGYGYPT